MFNDSLPGKFRRIQQTKMNVTWTKLSAALPWRTNQALYDFSFESKIQLTFIYLFLWACRLLRIDSPKFSKPYFESHNYTEIWYTYIHTCSHEHRVIHRHTNICIDSYVYVYEYTYAYIHTHACRTLCVWVK